MPNQPGPTKVAAANLQQKENPIMLVFGKPALNIPSPSKEVLRTTSMQQGKKFIAANKEAQQKIFTLGQIPLSDKLNATVEFGDSTKKVAPQPMRFPVDPKTQIVKKPKPEEVKTKAVFTAPPVEPIGPKPSTLFTSANAKQPEPSPRLVFQTTKEGDKFINQKYGGGPDPKYPKDASIIQKFNIAEEASHKYTDPVAKFVAGAVQLLPRATVSVIAEQLKNKEYTPDSFLAKIALGEEPVKSLFVRTQENIDQSQEFLEKRGVSKQWAQALSIGFIPPLMAGVEALDLLPVAGAESKVEATAKQFAKQKTAQEILPGLKTIFGAGDNLLMPMAENFAKIEDPAEIEKILRAFTKTPEGQIPVSAGQKGLNELDRIFKEDTKPSLINQAKETIRKIPEQISTAFVSKFTPLTSFERDIYKAAGKEIPKNKLGMQATAELFAGSAGKGELAVRQFEDAVIKPVLKYKDDFNKFLALLRIQSRVGTGLERTKVLDWTKESVQETMGALREKVGEEAFNLFKGQAVLYDQMMDNSLKGLVSSGIISPESYKTIKATNDFYAKFKVLKYAKDAEDMAVKSGSGTLSLGKDDVIRAMSGITDTEFKLQDLLSAGAEVIYRNKITAEKNKTMQALKEVFDLVPENSGLLVKLREEKNVLRRQEIARDLPGLREELENAKQLYSETNEADRKIISKINAALKEIDDLSTEAINTFVATEPEDSKRLIQQLTIKTDNRAAIKQGEKEAKNIGELDLTLDVKTKERVKVLTQDARRLEDELAKMQGQYDAAKIAFSEDGKQVGKLRTIENQYLKKQEELLTALQEKEHILSQSDTIYLGAPKPEPKISLKSENVGPSAKESIDKQIVKNNSAIDKLKSGIAKNENKVADLENKKFQTETSLDNLIGRIGEQKQTIRNSLAEMRALADVKLKTLGNEFEKVSLYTNGIREEYALPTEVARAVKGMNQEQVGVFGKVLAVGAKPFRWGVTTANAGFQMVNALFADIPRNLIMSKLGSRPEDIIRFPLDTIYAYYTSMKGNFGKMNELYQQFLESGVANSTIARELNPQQFARAKTLTSKANPMRILDTINKFANAIEEGGKILGLKRGLRDVGRGNISEAQMIDEVRKYAGSPDFLRKGTASTPANLLLMFFNARIQGTTLDLKRLGGLTGGREAAQAWTKLASIVGVPATTLAIVNKEKYAEDYEKLSQTEKDNYFIIFRDSFDTNEKGELYRKYWKIPKRENIKLFSNLIEASVDFAYKHDLESAKEYGYRMLSDLSPVNVTGKDLEERGESVLSGSNPIIKAPLEYITNRNFFFHSDQVPQTISGVPTENIDPAEQYYLKTPDLYKWLGKQTGQSPIKLQNLISNISGGLLNKDPLTSIIDRFKGTGRLDLTKSEVDQFNKVVADLEKQSSQALKTNRKAQEVYDQIGDLSPEEQRPKLIEMIKSKQLDEAAFNRYVDVYKKMAMDFQPIDYKLQQLQVTNGARAKSMYKLLEPLSKEEQRAKLKEWKGKNLLSQKVFDQVVWLFNNPTTTKRILQK